LLRDRQATQVAALAYREFMRTVRSRHLWRARVSESLSHLI
jgi:hypothetical protein